MATQSGILVSAANEPYTVVHDLARPKPGPKQVLVKSLAMGVNPVEPYMQHYGLLVVAWPVVLGCEASGVVVEVGSEVTRLAVGDAVYGCTRLGFREHGTMQDAFLMDAEIAIKRTGDLTVESACTVGVGLETAALGILGGLGVDLPEPGAAAEPKDEWLVVLGASGSVGQYGVQLGKLCGYKVLASCSPSKASIPLAHGATATMNGRGSMDEQLAEIKKATGGKFAKVFDASNVSHEVAFKALETCSTLSSKMFSTVDDMSDMTAPASVALHRVTLGRIGRYDDELGVKVTRELASWIPHFEGHIERGTLKSLDYELAPGSGWDAVIAAVALLEAGKVKTKIVIKIQDE